uniref:Uncharacterized protein n=1 Tax=Rhizophora mucronata TaxID=61149 RepID=A0A2P2N1Z3_RHIMU
MREVRELSKTLNEPKWFNPMRLQHHQPDSDSKLFLHTEMIIQQRPMPHMSLSLWPDSQMKRKQQDLHSVETPTVLMLGLWPEGKRANKRKYLWNSFDDSAFDDIDTSLHL